ncbi:hypothetical protein AHAS_Ahas06G0213900 [Arachis hypogaea]
MGIPLVKPYLGIKSGKIKDWNPTMEGVNFAVGGATALDSSFFIDKGIFASNNYTLSVQLDWFMNLLPSLSNSSSGLKEILGSSLFLVGEIGGNDFNHPLKEHKSIKEIRKYVPLVINEISSAINKLIEVGAQTLVVPGNFPIGCNFKYLTMFQTSNKSEYDEAGCLKSLNKFAQYYNDMLYAELNRLRLLHPTTTIIYADYYNSALRLYRSPTQFGITEPISSACCPLTDVNNPTDLHCGSPGVIACVDPSQYIPWDGWHLTEAAYKLIAQDLLSIFQWTKHQAFSRLVRIFPSEADSDVLLLKLYNLVLQLSHSPHTAGSAFWGNKEVGKHYVMHHFKLHVPFLEEVFNHS